MALIRGMNSRCCCPICLVPTEKLMDLHLDFPLRTAADSRAIVKAAQTMKREEANELLKIYGLRPVENVFWNIANTDVHQALSFDRLHAYHLGLFGDHLFAEVLQMLGGLGRNAASQADQQYEYFIDICY
ncbi:uncharacterized protein LAESUDRAFT_718389 [Laetiporus sulphureus 93-53]|uniref:Uncharacterized protein n=1 Tax=Laetiporus sulphureus 93-53 TaxID=1314785 RepID=A0A165B0A7_9APHY|nr:uncharacterized protein LAESUDRAFT_718389 [Laetiporus sulphureus 93-53]KZS99987.1 hypothetical protein LAESUDRAFT_718389 [Laetiporus sulphureus 93-53]